MRRIPNPFSRYQEVTLDIKDVLAHYLRRGYRLLPLEPNGKKPLARLVPQGLKQASDSLATILRWAKAAPGCNWGLLPPAEVLVLDIDDPARWSELLEQLPELGEAPRQRTPRGGYHVFLRLPNGASDLSASTSALPGIDVRGLARAYLVVEPSTVGGKPYQWERPLVPLGQLPEVPSALLERLLPAPPPPAPPPTPAAPVRDGDRLQRRLRGLLEWACEEVSAAPVGERHNTLLRTARLVGGWVHHGLSEAEALEALVQAAVSTGLPEAEARRTARDGLEYGKAKPLDLPPVGQPDPHWPQAALPVASRRGQPRVSPEGAMVKVRATPVTGGYVHHRAASPGHASAYLEGEHRAASRSEHRAASRSEHQEEYHLTDLGNAKRLVARHGHDLRFVPAWGTWFIWDGRRWARDETGEVFRRAKETVLSIYQEAATTEDADRRKALADWARRSESEARIRAMVKLAESEPGIPVRLSDLDRDPWLLSVLNGTLDLRTGELRPHNRADLITKMVPVEYDPAAEAPTWHRFLDRIMGGNQSLVEFLQRAVGYSLTGDVSEQCLFLCYGTGANGKTVFLRTLLALLGPYGKPVEPDLLLIRHGEAHPTGLADLFGARLAVALETGAGRRLNEPLVKWLTGGDKLKARFMRQDFFEFEPMHKLWLATNHKPVIRGTDYAIWRRIKMIPFTVTIPEDEQDPRLVDKLRAELPGILAWAVEGCLEWQRKGLGVPDEVRRATEAYREEQDALAAFLAECCVVSPTAKAAAKDLYQAYVAWCEQNGERPEPQRALGMRLTERGFERYKSHGTIWWRGLGLRDEGTMGTNGDQFSPLAAASRIPYREMGEKGPHGPQGPHPSVDEVAATDEEADVL